ncbi:MAG: hypothetical protein U0271_40765 [Polyangiaceae bacterium]
MIQMFHAGGFGMFPTALFGLLLLVTSLRYAVTPERRFVPSLKAMGTLTVASGAFGFVMGVIKSLSLLGQVEPDRRWIWLVGLGESLNNLALAFGVVMLAAMLTTAGAMRRAREA